jgi:hypothetical protein
MNTQKNVAETKVNLKDKLAQFANANGLKKAKGSRSGSTLYCSTPEYLKAKKEDSLKTFRKKMRTELSFFMNSLEELQERKQVDKSIQLVKLFEEYYTENYSLNDYSVSSLYGSSDEDRIKQISSFLNSVSLIRNKK